jgi:glycosyltransferase involved in cell wall biosynthesis
VSRGGTLLRVVYLDHTARLSGGELALARLLGALDEVDAHVILAEDGPLLGLLRRTGASTEVLLMDERARGLPRGSVSVASLPLASLAGAIRHVGRLAGRLRQLRPDLVHTNSLKAALYGAAAARLVGVPCIWHVRDRIAPDYLPRAAVRLVRAAGRALPAAFVVDSATTAATLPAGRGPVHIVPSPVELATPSKPESTDGQFRVGILGRIASWKGQDLFLRAFAQAFPHGPERAVIVGSALFEVDRPFAASLEGLAAELGIASRVELRGFKEHVGEELARLDVLVHASRVPEPFGQVVVEGMAAGLAVVVPDAGGPAEYVTDAEHGLHYRMGDRDALASALVRVAGDPELRDRLGRAGRQRAEAFAPKRIAAEVLAVYREVLAPRQRFVPSFGTP